MQSSSGLNTFTYMEKRQSKITSNSMSVPMASKSPTWQPVQNTRPTHIPLVQQKDLATSVESEILEAGVCPRAIDTHTQQNKGKLSEPETGEDTASQGHNLAVFQAQGPFLYEQIGEDCISLCLSQQSDTHIYRLYQVSIGNRRTKFSTFCNILFLIFHVPLQNQLKLA